MENKLGIIIGVAGIIIGTSIVAFPGLGKVGIGTVKYWLQSRNLINVKGLSERRVRADIADMIITVSNKGYHNLEELYKKRTSDKEKLIAFLKAQGVKDDEIIDSSMKTSDYQEENKTTSLTGTVTTEKTNFFKSEDTVSLRTKEVEKVEKIKSNIIKLSAEGILVTYSYSYGITDFLGIKLEMMKEASENARKSAEAFLAPQGAKLGDVVSLTQGEISIRAENESENVYYWDSKEKTSINKKLRLVVSASFNRK